MAAFTSGQLSAGTLAAIEADLLPRIEAAERAARRAVVPPVVADALGHHDPEDTARLEPGQRSAWPHGQLRAGGTVDLREVPGPEERSHDDVYLGGVEEGYVAVENGRLGMTFRLEFDPEVFRWLISWQPYGGAMAPPLGGSYALGIEPWVSRLDLAAAVRRSEAIELPGGDTFHTVVRARIERGDSWPR